MTSATFDRLREHPAVVAIVGIGGLRLVIALAPFLAIGWLARMAYRFGHFMIVQLPIALMGMLFGACALLVFFAIGKTIWDNAHDPAYPLHKDAVQIQWQQTVLHDANVIRRKQGLPELRESESPLPELRAKYARDLVEFEHNPVATK